MNWQPIETAPKDGTRILVYGPGPDEPQTASWRANKDYRSPKEAWRPTHHGVLDNIRLLPTHWMPLPDPPRRPKIGWRHKGEAHSTRRTIKQKPRASDDGGA